MFLLALDDTDTPHEGCTTHTAHRIAEAIAHADGPLRDWGLLAPGRLVRLNPAAEHKTRGNGALVLPIGPDPGTRRVRIGTWSDGSPLRIPEKPPDVRFPDPGAHSDSVQQALTRIVQDVLPRPGPGAEDPQPAALLLERPPASRLYSLAVSESLPPEQVQSYVPAGTLRLTPSGRRGETGALAAAAWSADTPGSGRVARWTWEAIAYRNTDAPRPDPAPWGSRIEGIPGGFDNVDPYTARLRAVPRTPCPVAFALRGRDPHTLLDPLQNPSPPIQTTPVPGWLVLTNQATGDHARWATSTLAPHKIVVAHVTVAGTGRRNRGGHLFVPATHQNGDRVLLAAYEPTKNLRRPLQATAPGDRLTVCARTRSDPHLLALEAFRVDALAPRMKKRGNPRCNACHKSTKSRGAGAGYRCPDCHRRFTEVDREQIPVSPAPLQTGARFQVPDHVRGHLLPPVQGLAPSKGLGNGVSARVPSVLSTPAGSGRPRALRVPPPGR